jgi:hypothetical protein
MIWWPRSAVIDFLLEITRSEVSELTDPPLWSQEIIPIIVPLVSDTY